jgi:hypothetical protein
MSRSFRLAVMACMLVVLLPPCWCCSWSLTATPSSSCCRTIVTTPKRSCCSHAAKAGQKSERTSTPKTEKDCCATATKQIVRSEIKLRDPLVAIADWVSPSSLRRDAVLRNVSADRTASLGNQSLQIWHCSWQC